MSGAPPSLTFIQQAIRLRGLIPSMKMSDGSPAKMSFVQVDADDAAFLDAIAARLERMHFHEAAIRKLVAGR